MEGLSMSIKEKIIDDINRLKPEMLPAIYDYIKNLETDTDTEAINDKYKNITHKDIQKALCISDTTWSDDLSKERDERI